MLNVTTPELWPITARQILKDKNISVDELKETFQEITFPWDDKYNTERVYFPFEFNSDRYLSLNR